jgi:hypothetical protein
VSSSYRAVACRQYSLSVISALAADSRSARRSNSVS